MDFKKGSKNRFSGSSRGENEHTSWLDDDEWQALRDSTESRATDSKKRKSLFSQETSAYDTAHDEELRKVELNIKFKLPNIYLRRLKLIAQTFQRLKNLSRAHFIAISLSLVLLVAGIVVMNKYIFEKDFGDASVAGSQDSVGRTPADPLPKEKPQFDLLYPGNKDQQGVGEIVKISPDQNEPVYAYVDKISEVPIQISQQKLPKHFEGKVDIELEKIARDFQATQKFTVDSVNVYHGKSNSGVQSLVFVKGNLLVFIKSSNELGEDTWATYISALHS